MTPADVAAYIPRRLSRTHALEVRGVRYQVREWGLVDAPPLILLHGALDTSVSFQFFVDALEGDWHVVAPDWRGHGGSGHTPGSYWHADFACDLDALLDTLVPDRPVPVVAHSMGANIASLYAGLRPTRIASLVMLDALGSPVTENPERIVDTVAGLLDLQHARPRRRYVSLDLMAQRLIRADRRLDVARARFLAEAIAVSLPGGDYGWPYDPTFCKSLPTLHGAVEWGECWRRIEAPVVLLLSTDARPGYATDDADQLDARVACFRRIATRRIYDTSHNFHHHAADRVARMIEPFLRDPSAVTDVHGQTLAAETMS